MIITSLLILKSFKPNALEVFFGSPFWKSLKLIDDKQDQSRYIWLFFFINPFYAFNDFIYYNTIYIV